MVQRTTLFSALVVALLATATPSVQAFRMLPCGSLRSVCCEAVAGSSAACNGNLVCREGICRTGVTSASSDDPTAPGTSTARQSVSVSAGDGVVETSSDSFTTPGGSTSTSATVNGEPVDLTADPQEPEPETEPEPEPEEAEPTAASTSINGTMPMNGTTTDSTTMTPAPIPEAMAETDDDADEEEDDGDAQDEPSADVSGTVDEEGVGIRVTATDVADSDEGDTEETVATENVEVAGDGEVSRSASGTTQTVSRRSGGRGFSADVTFGR